jgi:hypothetical protein
MIINDYCSPYQLSKKVSKIIIDKCTRKAIKLLVIFIKLSTTNSKDSCKYVDQQRLNKTVLGK